MSEQDAGVVSTPQPGAVTPEGAESLSGNPPLGGTPADESRTSESNAVTEESDQQKAERLVKERQVREQRERNEAAAQRRILERDRDAYRKMTETLIQTLQRNQAPPQPPQVQQQARPPTRDFDPTTGRPFDSYERFVEARAAYVAEQRALQLIESRQQQQAAQAQQVAQAMEQQRVAADHGSRVSQFARAVPDWDAVTAREDIHIPPAAANAITRLHNGPAILYEIGRDESIARNLSGMGPLEQVVYIGQLSHWVASQGNPQFSNAAPVGRGVRSSAATSDSPPTDTEAYFKWANKKFGKR